MIDPLRLRRRVAFERLLARLFAEAEPPWLLKRGYAFRFLISALRGELTEAPSGGARCGVETVLAGRTLAQFHMDVGLGD
jgi:hypothetical protein